MPEAEMRWRLQGGFSQLLEGTHAELILKSDHTRATLEAVPAELLRGRGSLDFEFRAARTWRARGPAGLRWEFSPEGRIEARLLCAGSAFLGNFRVPNGHVGVQWTVVGRVSTSSSRELGPSVLQARAGSWVNYTWVDMATGDSSPREALLASWAGFRDPFDPEEILLTSSRQVCQLTWTGRCRLGFRLNLDLVRGWQVDKPLSMLELQARLRSGLQFGVQARWEREGTYALRVQRRNGRIRLTLRRQQTHDRTAGIEVGVFGSSQADAGVDQALIDPILEPVRDKLDEAVKRRLEMLLALELSEWTRKKSMIEAEWTNPREQDFSTTYRSVLAGNVPSPATGLKITSLLESLQGRRTSLKVNFLNWFTLGIERTRERRISVRIDALGRLLVEEGRQIEETRYRWDERQFFRLLTARRPGEPSSLRWFWGTDGRVSRRELLGILRPALHVSALDSVSVPGSRSFPTALRLTWVTEIAFQGIESMQKSSPEERWRALVRSMELAEPERYRPGSFWRDWIDCPELRDVFERNPVQCHLQSLYPVEGRNDAQRRHVIGEYRRCRSFLQLFSDWAANRDPEPTELARQGLNVPIFLFVHLLCPPQNRRSAIVLSGGLEAVWGDKSLI